MFIKDFTFLLIFNILISALCQSSFNKEYPGVNICQSGNLQDLNLHDAVNRKKDINNIISKNCTHLQGSLFIKGLTGMRGESILLDSIREIDGHLIIEGNDVEVISLKSLIVIRGYVSKPHTLADRNQKVNITLQVTGNLYLKNLNIASLRSIANHDILFDNNPLLGYLPHKINWSELFSKPKSQKIISNKISKDILFRDVCSSDCSVWPRNNITFCWGPLTNQCQIKTLCESYSTECDTCLYKNGKEINCCDQLCIGGCHKIGPENCMACKQMLDGKKCVETCPSRYTGGIAGLKQNQAFKYYSGSFCSTTCPETMLTEDAACVHHCSEGFYKNKSNECIKCSGDMCKKDDMPCDLMKLTSGDERGFILSGKVLEQLTNCTKIRGYINIKKESFTVLNVTVKMLYDHLSNLEELEGGFNYYVDSHLTNLTFLAKLKTFRQANLHAYIQGNPEFNKFSISNTKLKFLGLKSLKKIIGKMFIGTNKNLCYLDLPWSEIVNGPHKILPKKCSNEKCDKECSSQGCWMSGNNWCFECQNFNANGSCVAKCSSVRGYFLSNSSNQINGTCDKCNEECSRTCNGASANDCIGGCVHKEENGVCVRKCSFQSFEKKFTNKCEPCNRVCTDIGKAAQCTGPSNKPGPGGCNKCHHILINRSTGSAPKERIINCVHDCPVKTYARATDNDEITKFFHLNGYVCEPCHSLCKKCSGRRQHKDDCTSCEGYWNRDMCVETCSKESTYGYKSNNSSRTCLLCNKACSGGCSGPTEFDCKVCRYRKLYLNGTKFSCQNSCPLEKNIEEMDKVSGEIVCFNLWESAAKREELRRTKIVISAVLVMLLIVILMIAVVVVCLRKKASAERFESELKARYSNLTEPNSKDENAFSKPPNMGRLAIISIRDLAFDDETKPLGYGAFGYVYKGTWKLPKDDDVIIKKSAGDFYLPVAIKVIKNIGSSESDAIMQEAKIMSSVSHMHCLRFIGICLSYEKPCLVTAYVKEGSLEKFLVRCRNKISSLIMLSWAEQIADGMLYLTKRGIIHRDLAARNVLVSRLECVQITDFGLSKMLENTKEREIIIKSGKVPIRWLAIETLLEGKYSYETDVWAYGVTLWEIFTFAKIPYEDQATLDIADFVMKGGRLSQPDICSLDVYIVMVNCWLESPNLRPDFESLMKTFMGYCKNPGRYLSIQGDPFEIPSPSNIEMTNMNNPYNEQFNFVPGTAETLLPLLNNRDSIDSVHKNCTLANDTVPYKDDESNSLLLTSYQEALPTRTTNRTSNIFKRFQEKSQPSNTQNSAPTNNNNNNNTNSTKLVPLASLEEPSFQGSSIDEDARYVADPSNKSIKLRQNPTSIRTQMSETPRFHSNPILKKNAELAYNLPPPPKPPNLNVDSDGYLEPVQSPNPSHVSTASNDTDGYLEPVLIKKKISVDRDEYMTPSYNNTPRESLRKTSNTSRLTDPHRQYEDNSPSNLYFPQKLVDNEQSKTALIK